MCEGTAARPQLGMPQRQSGGSSFANGKRRRRTGMLGQAAACAPRVAIRKSGSLAMYRMVRRRPHKALGHCISYSRLPTPWGGISWPKVTE